ncbi:IS630 transposase-related protein [Candidatus Halobeggiatoa sp. HSG11]|nr:IS630 transposase-related protein [Candidatus Halobeggiatoa sp. HSG11]
MFEEHAVTILIFSLVGISLMYFLTMKINLATLKKQVSEHPDWFQHEHAQTFDVTQSAISYSVGQTWNYLQKNISLLGTR